MRVHYSSLILLTRYRTKFRGFLGEAYMAEAVAQLKREGYPVNEGDLAHIWPTRYAHLNVYGQYHFNIEEARRRKGLRPLRQSSSTIS